MNSFFHPLQRLFFYLFFTWLLTGGPETGRLAAQVNAVGKPGLIMTPNTDWMEQRQLGLGFSYIPQAYAINGFMNSYHNEHLYSVRVGMTDWMEIYLNVTRVPALSDQIGIGDRHMDFRFRLLKEDTYGFSAVLILSPPGSFNQFLNHDALVLGKKMSIGPDGTLSFSGGYGIPYLLTGRFLNGLSGFQLGFKSKSENGMNYLNGFFGGFSWSWKELLGLQAEYDSRSFNAGIFLRPRPWIVLQGHTFEFKDWGATVSLHFPLDHSPKELRSHEK